MLRISSSGICLVFAAIANSQVELGSFSRSEFYPNLVVSANERSVFGTFEADGLHYSVSKLLEVRSDTGLGYGIQGDVQYFRVGDQSVIASAIRMSWTGTHQIQFDVEPASSTTPLAMDVRLVKFGDFNENGQWDAGEQQWDLAPQLLIESSMMNSMTLNVFGERGFDEPIFLDPNSSYFFGGSATYNISNSSLGPHSYHHRGTQSFDIVFSTPPVPEPGLLAILFASIVPLWLKRKRRQVAL